MLWWRIVGTSKFVIEEFSESNGERLIKYVGCIDYILGLLNIWVVLDSNIC